MRPFSRKMFHVWDENHRLQVWFPYIEKVQALEIDWHICVDNFVFDSKTSLIEPLTVMTELNN
jgi:hypothetical protein